MAKHKMIILQNKSNSGKTSTLRELANILISKGGKSVLIEGDLIHGDFIIKVSYNNQEIIIISMGDIGEELKKKYNQVWDNYTKIDIIFGACRTKGETVSVVKEQAKDKFFNIIWTATYKNKSDQQNLNNKRANELFRTFC